MPFFGPYFGPSGSGGSAGGWYYADEQAVEDLIGIANLDTISQLDPDSIARDTARIQRGGEWADAYIDAKLAANGWTTPLDAMSAPTVLILKDINARLVAWWLSNNRPVSEDTSDDQRKAILALYKNHKKMADDTLAEIIGGDLAIIPDRSEDDAGSTPGTFASVTINRAGTCVADENSN